MTDESRARQIIHQCGLPTDPMPEELLAYVVREIAAARSSERRYIIDQIRTHATELTFYAKGRALDLLAWILELPKGADR